MIPWVNLTVLLVPSLLALYFYVRSVSPAAREREIGAVAYRKCFTYRIIAPAGMVRRTRFEMHPNDHLDMVNACSFSLGGACLKCILVKRSIT